MTLADGDQPLADLPRVVRLDRGHELSGLRKGLPARQNRRQGWRLTATGAAIDPAQVRRAKRQAAILNSLRQHPQGLDQALLRQHQVKKRVIVFDTYQIGLYIAINRPQG